MSAFSGYICDKCGAEHRHTPGKSYPAEAQPCTVSMYINYGETYVADINYRSAAHSRTWCRKCLNESGFIAPNVEPKPEAPARPSANDLLVQALRECGFVTHEDLTQQ